MEGVILLWKATDRWGNTIELTEERWNHIAFWHPDLENHLEEILLTLKYGRRKQDPFEPGKYKYYRKTNALLPQYNYIVAIVKFVQNNFVITAYPIFKYSK
ncbi:hypothetical protein KKE26_06880 [bacterium]|nr:hypothetical protein [bacterium]